MFFSVFVSAKDFWDREKTNQEQKWGEATTFLKMEAEDQIGFLALFWKIWTTVAALNKDLISRADDPRLGLKELI